MKYRIKLPSLGLTEKAFSAMPFGRQIEWHKKIAEWKVGAKSVHISQKRRTNAAAMKEFRSLYKPKEYFAAYHDSENYYDDAFEIFYKD